MPRLSMRPRLHRHVQESLMTATSEKVGILKASLTNEVNTHSPSILAGRMWAVCSISCSMRSIENEYEWNVEAYLGATMEAVAGGQYFGLYAGSNRHPRKAITQP